MERLMPTKQMLTIADGATKIMKGDESWPIIGGAVPGPVIKKIIAECRGLNLQWDCIEKAQIARRILGRGFVVMGELMVMSGDYKSEYGFYYNPPYELHAWVVFDGGFILDVGLPGVIDKGLTSGDSVGPFLVNREPFILAGRPLDWTRYDVKYIPSKGVIVDVMS